MTSGELVLDLSSAVWRKSSRSGSSDGGNCVEVAFLDRAAWRKSSRSGSTAGGNCVEVAFLDGPAVAVRDSKDPTGPALAFAPSAWSSFLHALHQGTFDLPS